MTLGVPTLLIYGYAANPGNGQWHVSGISKVLCQFLLLAMLAAMYAVGLYLTLFVRTVTLDMPCGSVTRITRVLGKIIHRQVWSFSEFTRIELKHYRAGSDTDMFQSDVGIRHRSGMVVWLRAFQIKSDKPSLEALAFVAALGEMTGLEYGK